MVRSRIVSTEGLCGFAGTPQPSAYGAGVSQARIAEIEANPGLVNLEQLMKLLSVLGVSLTLQEEPAVPAATRVPAAKTAKPKAAKPEPKPSSRPPEVKPASRRTLVARPKKGSC